MKTALSIGFAALLAGCAGAAPRPQSEATQYGHWQGYLLHDGRREPVSVDLSDPGSSGDSQLSSRDNSVPLEGLSVSGNSVHFEASGEGVFDGTVAGDEMNGSVSGPSSGEFSLNRVQDWTPYPVGP